MGARTTTIFTADFRRAFAEETKGLLRKRFLWFTGLVGAFELINAGTGIVLSVWGRASNHTHAGDHLIGHLLHLLVGPIFLAAFVLDLRRRLSDAMILGATTALVVLQGGMNILIVYLFEVGDAAALPTWGRALIGVLFTHILACAFLPWTVRQCLRPIVWLVAINALFLLGISDLDPQRRVLVLLLSPLVGLPGAVVCAVRQLRRAERSKFRFLQSRYGEVRKELMDARKVHEDLFPDPIETGPIRMQYRYEPMRQIGGDFLFARRGDEGSVLVVLADVTGHGIPAALTVNRLYGELERLTAERPWISPGELLEGLNRYAHLTLAPHSIYLTAFCARIDPDAGRLTYASAGHPPAFLRTVDGRLEELGSTTIVLGAVPAGGFQAGEQEQAFAIGDSLVLYTDGAIECHRDDGEMFGIDRVRALLASSDSFRPGQWTSIIMEQVESFRDGPARDDTLVVEVYRPLH